MLLQFLFEEMVEGLAENARANMGDCTAREGALRLIVWGVRKHGADNLPLLHNETVRQFLVQVQRFITKKKSGKNNKTAVALQGHPRQAAQTKSCMPTFSSPSVAHHHDRLPLTSTASAKSVDEIPPPPLQKPANAKQPDAINTKQAAALPGQTCHRGNNDDPQFRQISADPTLLEVLPNAWAPFLPKQDGSDGFLKGRVRVQPSEAG